MLHNYWVRRRAFTAKKYNCSSYAKHTSFSLRTVSDGLHNYVVSYRYNSVEEYSESTHMTTNATWGTDFKMYVLAHLLHTPVYSFQGSDYQGWRKVFSTSSFIYI